MDWNCHSKNSNPWTIAYVACLSMTVLLIQSVGTVPNIYTYFINTNRMKMVDIVVIVISNWFGGSCIDKLHNIFRLSWTSLSADSQHII